MLKISMLCSMLTNLNVLLVILIVNTSFIVTLLLYLFYISGKKIDVVDKWPHLGHIISKYGDDSSDILNRQESFIGQANNVICWFGKLDCRVKTELLKAYCSSFYASELWDLGNDNINAL